ncbi:hypothetical protein AEAC466_17340 [Asticcacaulis sp. AC466]|uniref:prohead protease/major capsid protein fusion protein n=1 Tax=Asticcacaulis sp. AC466 TaxID=1282362 RepID=UPI0003C40400|nr:prohead protease/major capsid protein fusion protein [Asticcacaulis sp. AC466]ESQ82387.1 hypothetical protein AEAC466_17340 [Asticcacaulis sp. AC466]
MSKTTKPGQRDTRLPVQRRMLDLAPATYNQEARTVELNAATGFRVMRWGWDGSYMEQLQISGDAIELSRVDKGQCPLLDTHSRWSVDDQLGLVTGSRIDAGALVLTVQFADSDKGREIENRVAAGDLRGVSVGYRVLEMTLIGKDNEVPVYEVTRWELLEVSLVPVPADPDSGVRSAANDLHPCTINERRTAPMDVDDTEDLETEENRGTPPKPSKPAGQRSAPKQALAVEPKPEEVRMTTAESHDFEDQARAFGVDIVAARQLVLSKTPEQARAELLRLAADAQSERSPKPKHGEAGRIGRDARDTQREAVEEALLHRFDPVTNKLTDKGREYRGMSLIEMGRDIMAYNGLKVRGMTKREVAEHMLSRQHTTSDFPIILGNIANRTLRAGYEGSAQTFRMWMRRVTLSDFKPVTRAQLGGAPSMLLVPEGGEFKLGTIGEAKEVYALATYGRRFSITRQVIINDDLDAFTRLPAMYGRAAADFESDAAYAPLLANPNMGDGNALFSTAHGNIAASGAQPSEASFQEAYFSMSNQTGLEGRLISVQPKYVLTGIKDQISTEKLLTGVTATTTSGVNVFSRRGLEPVFEPRLNLAAGNATPWFMAADYNQVDTAEYAYLDGEDGVFLDQKEGWEIDGVDFKARLDFGTKFIDYRGVFKNPGVA